MTVRDSSLDGLKENLISRSVPHPNDMRPDGHCRGCGDRLSRMIRKRNGKRAYRRHLTNPNCPTKGSGEAT